MLLAYGLGFGSIALVSRLSYPAIRREISANLKRRADRASEQLSDIFLYLSRRTVWLMYAVSPVVTAAIFGLVSNSLIAALVGFAFGFLVPKLVITHTKRTRLKLFGAQLVDGLLLLSSSLKAGLSMTQAFTVVVEEMPAPISQEFGLVLKESQMGVNLEEALGHLRRRVPSDDLMLFITAVLVSRETGGDVTSVFRRLVETLRERKKIKERIMTLTFMARLQGIIMGMLPFVFGLLVYNMDHAYFNFFLSDPTGRIMLIAIVVLQCIGGLLFLRFSRSPL